MLPNDLSGLAGLGAVAIAAISWLAERRRLRRADLDKVGWVPWTMVFFWALMVAVVLLALAARAWVAG